MKTITVTFDRFYTSTKEGKPVTWAVYKDKDGNEYKVLMNGTKQKIQVSTKETK